jgi:hypothetical protein
MGNWRALLVGLAAGGVLGVWALGSLTARPAPASPPDAGGPVDAGAGAVRPAPEAQWSVATLDLRSGAVVSEGFLYPVCGPTLAFPTPSTLDGGATVELGPAGGCSGPVVTAQMHPALLEVLSQRSGVLETSLGWLPTTQVPFLSTLVLEGPVGLWRAPLPLVNPTVVYRSPGGSELLLFDDDGACAADLPGEASGFDAGTPTRARGLASGRLLRVRLAPDVLQTRLEGGWRRTCE